MQTDNKSRQYAGWRDSNLREPIDPKFVTPAPDNFGQEMRAYPDAVPRAFAVCFASGNYVPLNEKNPTLARWKDATAYLFEGKRKVERMQRFVDWLEQQKQETTMQLLKAYQIRKTLEPEISQINPEAVKVTKSNFCSLINSMTEMAMPPKAKAMLHAAATLAVNAFEDDAAAAAAATEAERETSPQPSRADSASQSPARSTQRAGAATPGSTPQRPGVAEEGSLRADTPARDQPDSPPFGQKVFQVYQSSFSASD